jgi:hypothetical protein
MKHEIIYTEHYALIVSDEETKHGDFFISSQFFQPTLEKYIDPYNQSSITKKIIAYRPLTDAPILEGVPLLPEWNVCDEELLVPFPNSTRNRRLRDGSEIKTWMLGWEEGFKEAKETYKYTEEDLRKAIEMAITSKYEYKLEFYNQNEIIQSLQQPKRPKCFECEMEQLPSNESFGLDYGSFNLKPKTITNPQGQTELSGKYIFE